MQLETLKVEIDGPVAVVTLDRPERLNAISRRVRAEFWMLLDHFEEDDDVRVMVWRGAGRAFSAGADVKELPMGEYTGLDFYFSPHIRDHMLWERMWRFRKPLIAEVHGHCLGLGLEMAIECDLILAADDALFGEPEIDLAFSYGFTRLPKLIGKKRAMLLSLTGESIDAATAEAWGLINNVFPKYELHQETMKLARKLAEKSMVALWLTKHGMNVALEVDGRTAVVIESLIECIGTSSSDFETAMRAFREGKETPSFTGGLPKHVMGS